jgi:(R)-2-hydroxyglutarate---pyruvate transhydrogenase
MDISMDTYFLLYISGLRLTIDDHRGSISAEHGLGFAKNKYLKYSKSEADIVVMRKIKNLFDPKGIMNPYKYLPPLEK